MPLDAFRVLPDGTVIGLWSDAAALPALGHVDAWRGSAVHWDGARQGWLATVFSTGEVLGPFPTRQAAVDAERHRLAALLEHTAPAPSRPPMTTNRPPEAPDFSHGDPTADVSVLPPWPPADHAPAAAGNRHPERPHPRTQWQRTAPDLLGRALGRSARPLP